MGKEWMEFLREEDGVGVIELVLLLVVALLVGGAAAMFAGRMGVNSNYTLTKEEYENWQYMQSTYGKTDMLKKMMESSYYVPVDGSKLIESSYYGLIEGLGDPYSEYVSKEEYEDYFSSMIGEYSGVGMSFYNNPDGVLEVVQVFRNSPAKEAGMQPGDIILKVDGKEYSGSQSSVTVIRAISLGEVDFMDLAAVVWKEIRSSVMCGIALACACFGKIMLIDRLLLHNTDVTVLVALVVCFTMVLTVMVAEMIGCTLPIIAKRLGFDPAVMASPFITTIVDAVSLLLYFGIASALLFR